MKSLRCPLEVTTSHSPYPHYLQTALHASSSGNTSTAKDPSSERAIVPGKETNSTDLKYSVSSKNSCV